MPKLSDSDRQGLAWVIVNELGSRFRIIDPRNPINPQPAIAWKTSIEETVREGIDRFFE